MNGRFVLFLAGLAIAGTTLRVSAHHSFAAEFDANQPITIEGVITQVRLENPHSWFFMDVTDASGKVSKWSFEASTPTSLIRSGFGLLRSDIPAAIRPMIKKVTK